MVTVRFFITPEMTITLKAGFPWWISITGKTGRTRISQG